MQTILALLGINLDPAYNMVDCLKCLIKAIYPKHSMEGGGGGGYKIVGVLTANGNTSEKKNGQTVIIKKNLNKNK